MWNTKNLKARGKAAFKANYWPCVLVAFILTALVGGGWAAMNNSAQSKAADTREELSATLSEETGNNITITEDGQWLAEIDGQVVNVLETEEFTTIILPAILIGVAIVVFVVWLITTIIDVFLINPVEVGCLYFFLRNSAGEGRVGDLKRGFKPAYMSNVKTLFMRDLFIYLWGLLLIVPGIIKAYAYRMVPYIIAEHPEMSAKEALALSNKMMNGNKMNAFLFDLSFIGWHILGGLTCGLVEAFFAAPYHFAASAELYRTLAAAQPELAK